MHILFRSLYQRPNVAMHDIHVPYPDIHGAYVTCIDLPGAKLVLNGWDFDTSPVLRDRHSGRTCFDDVELWSYRTHDVSWNCKDTDFICYCKCLFLRLWWKQPNLEGQTHCWWVCLNHLFLIRCINEFCKDLGDMHQRNLSECEWRV